MWIIFIAIIVFIIYKVMSFGNSEVEQKVTNHGGMQNKYKTLIDYFTESPSSKITKISKDTISISSPTTSVNIYFIGGSTEIVFNALLPTIGNISKKCSYSSEYSQERIIEDIENYIIGKMNEYKKNSESNFEQYINN